MSAAPFAHIATDRLIRGLLDQLDEAGRHIHTMGCTCLHACAQDATCVGYSTANEYWRTTNRVRRRAGIQTRKVL